MVHFIDHLGSFLSLSLLILSGELIFLLPYVLARVFRPTFLEVFNLNNFELGSLFSVYGTIALLSYIYGGVIADKFQPKKLIAASLFFTSYANCESFQLSQTNVKKFALTAYISLKSNSGPPVEANVLSILYIHCKITKSMLALLPCA